MQVHGEGMHELMHDFMCKFYKKKSQKLGCYKNTGHRPDLLGHPMYLTLYA
jgi:hypothetical protein